MADGYISQIKTPDNKTYLLRDSEKTDENVNQASNSENKEFPIILKNTNNTTNETAGVKYAGGVTVNPSDKTVTATEFIGNIKANRVKPTIIKEWSDTSFYGANISGQDVHDLSTFWMLSVKPDSWYEPWVVRFKITTTCPAAANYYSVTYCMYSGRADGTVVFNWNERYDHAHYYTNIRTLKKAGFDAGLGHAIGINLYASNNYTNANYYRSFKLEYYDCDNCTVTILDNPIKWANWPDGTTTNYNGNNNANAVDRGLQESGDANSYDLLQMSNNYVINGSFRFPGISLFGYDREGHAQPFSLYQSGYTSYTASISNKATRLYNTNGIDWTRGIHYNSSGGSWAENTNMNISTRLAQSAIDLRYTDNCVSTANTTLSITSRKAVYIRGTLDDDGLFHVAPLDVAYNGATYCRAWTQDIPTEVDNYVYWFVGYPYYTSAYQVNLYVENPLYWYHNGRFEEYRPASTVSWTDITNKPSTATSWPNWNQIQQSGANSIAEGSDNVTANTEILTSYASNNGFADTNGLGKVYRRDASKVVNATLVKAALGTNATHNNTFLRKDGTWQTALTTYRTYTAVSGKKPTGNQTPGFGSTFDIEQVGQDTTGQVSVTERTVKIPDTAASTSVAGLVTTGAQTFGGGKTLKFTNRIYPLIGTNAERSKWYKITFPYSTITTGSSAQWFMNSFDLHFGGGYSSNPSGIAHVTFYWTRAANNGTWTVGQQAAFIEGTLANKIGLYYRTAEPGVLYVNNTANVYNGIWIDNLYVDDSSTSLDWSTITITNVADITESTSPKLSDYTKITTSYLYNDSGTLKTDGNFEGKYIKGTWLYTSAATAKTSTAKLATIESDNFIYYITPANALKSAVGTTAIGAAKTPIYWDGSKFAAGDVLKNLAYKDSLIASDIPDLSETYVKKVTSTDNAIARFDGTGGQIQNSGVIIDDNNNISVSSILSNLYSGYNLCKLQTSASGTEIVIKTKFKFVSSSTMPSIRIHGYSYGKGAPLDLTIVYYIYGNEFYVPKVISTGGISPEIYLFTYTENNIKYVAVGIKSSLGYLGFTVDANGGALGGLNINSDSILCTTGWTIEHNGSNTSNTLIPAVNTDNCKLVPYIALSTTVEKTISANLTSTTNAIAYYTDTTGTFGSKASANGALYATSANGALQWGTLPIAQGGTGKTTANDAANALISGLPTWTASPTADTYFIRRDTGGTATFGQVKFSSIANITNGKITLGPYSITPVTSVNGHTGNEVTVTASDLGLSTAMHFLGVSTTAITDGGTENPTIGGTAITTKTAGDVVIDNNSRREYVWSTTNKWEMLGFDASTAYSQTTSGNTFISSVSQATDGTVTAETRALDTSGTWSGNAATATKLKDNATNTTRVFYRGDNTWSNILKQTSAAVLGIDTNSKIGTAVKDLHFTVGSGSGTGINDGNAGGITIGTDTASYGGIYWQSSGSYGLRLHFATTGSFANGAYTRMLITHDGKVGIGTLTPDTLLTVNGNAKADKFIGALQGNADTATNATNHIARTDNPHNVTAAQLGLGSVENTKLSTWAGSTNITTLGTIITGTWNGTAIANNKLANSSLTVGNKSINLGASGTVDEIITYSTTIGQNTSWDVTDSGTYRAYNSGGFSGDQNPGTNQNAPYPYGTLYVMRATTGGAAQFYISHHASAAKNAENGIRYRSGWDVANTEKTAAQRWEAWATILDDKNYNLYSPKLDGTGATGSWGITITGNAANVTGTVAIDHGGTGATSAADARTNLGLGTIATKADTAYIKFGGDDTGLGGSSPAATAKTYWADATKVSDNMITGYYNHSGTEYSLLFSKRSTYGSILKWGYGDRYLRILRVQGGTWKSTDWEKIDAGYADSAGSATSAGKWTTARTLTIGSTGKSVDGSGNVSWSLAEIGAASSDHEHDYIGNSRYIAYTTDGHYEGSGTVTGYIKIKIPKTKSATMLSFDVDIYNYSGDTSTRYHIAGYNYTDASWNNTTAYCIAPLSNAKANLTVRFLSNGDDEMYVTIGETDTSWSYPKVNVHNIVMGHSGNSLANWASGWTITITNTAFTSGQIKVTKTNTNIAYTAITAGTSTLAWNEEKTLYTIGDAVIKAKLPAMPTYSDVGAAPASTVSCTTANVQSILGINTSSGSTSKALTEKGTWVTFGTSNLTIGTTSTTAMAGNTTVTNVAISADTTTNKNYALVFGTTPSDGTTPTGAKTEGLQKNIAKLYVNPSTGNIQAATFNGYTLAAASAKSVVTSIDASASLPTSNAVKTFVEGKGYVTSSDITTAINDLDGTITGTPSNTNTITAFSQTNGKVSATFAAIDFPVTSVAGLTNAISASALTEALGLSKALRFVGVTTTDMTGGTATNHTYTGKPAGISDYTPAVGDVVINSTKQDEWVCIAVSGTTYTWERLGSDTSYKIVQSAVSDPTAASTTSTTFIDTISQNANGVISATKKTLPTASTEVAGIIKIGTGSTNAMAGDTTVTNVSYTATTDNYEYPVLMKNSTGSDTTAAGVRFASGTNQQVTINPSTGTVSTRRLVINNSSSNGTVPDLVFSRTSWSYINIPDNDAAILAIGRGTGDNASQKLIIQGDGVVRPGSDNTQMLGKSTRRWKEVHGVNFYGTFNGTATYSQGLAKWAISNSDLNNFVSNGALRYSWEGGNNNFNSKPTDVNAFGIIAMKTATNWTGQILMSTDTEPGLYWRTNLTTETPSYGSWTPLASGNGGVYYGTCETASNVAEKAVSCKHYHTLKAGDIIVVTFTNANTEAQPKLNVNNTGAVYVKMAYSGGIVDLGSTTQLSYTCTFIYDGTYWLIINQQNTIQLATASNQTNWRSILLSNSNSGDENFTPSANTLGRTYAAHNVKYQPSTGTLRAPIMKTPKVQIEYNHVNKAHIEWNDTDSSIDFIFD